MRRASLGSGVAQGSCILEQGKDENHNLVIKSTGLWTGQPKVPGISNKHT